MQDTDWPFRVAPGGIASTPLPFASNCEYAPGKQAFQISAGPATFGEIYVEKLILICAFLCSVSLICESAGSTKYRVATIVAVNPHSSDADSDSSARSYDVSVQIGNTVYVGLYAPRLALQTPKYAAGRQVLVLVGEDPLTYNDLCGNAIEAPILTRKVVAAAGSR